MNGRERVQAALRFQPVDRLPLVHFGFWPQTLEKWAREGHVTEEEARNWADNNPVDDALSARLGFDQSWTPAFSPRHFLQPPFEPRVVRELPGGARHVRNARGVVELVVPGAVSIPAEIEHTLVDRASWEAHYKWRFAWRPERVTEAPIRCGDRHLPVRGGGAEAFRKRPPDKARGLYCGSLIGWVRDLLGVEGLAYMAADDPELLREIIDTNGALCLRCVEETLRRVDAFDFAHFWEDICYNHGPLVNPRLFAEQVAPWYARITAVLRAHGIDLVSVDCDGCVDALIPAWLDAGVSIMFPIEVGTWNASIAPWRRQYGDRVKGIGRCRDRAPQAAHRPRRLHPLPGPPPAPRDPMGPRPLLRRPAGRALKGSGQ